jgi:hypothetical protein
MAGPAPFEKRRAELRLFLQRWRFTLLLALLSTGLLFQAAAGEAVGGVVAVDLLFGLLIVAAAIASEARRGLVWLLVALALARIGITAAVGEAGPPLAQSANVAVAVAMAAITLWITLSALFGRAAAGADALAGAGFGFLLLAVAFALVYIAVEIARPGAFALLEGGGSRAAQLIYFSLITLTTTGYGDVVAVTPVMRLATALEAAIGDLYLAVLIGRLLGVAFERKTRF